jgi:hypothetical protein
MNNTRLQYFQSIIELLKVIVWPTITLVIFALFWSPLYKIVEQLPNLVSKSNTVTVGQFSLRIDKGLSHQLSPDLKKILEQLSGPEVIALITSNVHHESTALPHGITVNLKRNIFWEDQLGINTPILLGLIKKGVYIKGETSSNDSDTESVSFDISPEGIRLKQFLLDLLDGFRKETST